MHRGRAGRSSVASASRAGLRADVRTETSTRAGYGYGGDDARAQRRHREAADADRVDPRLRHRAARLHRGERRAADDPALARRWVGGAAVGGERVPVDAWLADPHRRIARTPV